MTFIGLGTAINVGTIVVGSLLGLALGSRLNERTRTTVTHVLGLCTLVMAATMLLPMLAAPLVEAIPGGAVFLAVVLTLVFGTVIGSLLRLEDRTDAAAVALRRLLVRGQRQGTEHQSRFVNAFVTTTLLFGIGPMAILGSLQEGLGQGSSTLIVKAILDGVASIAFASALGAGVMASAVSIAVYQGLLTLLAWLLGDLMSPVQTDMISVVGGIMLLGLALRVLEIKDIKVGDMVPALLLAPVVVWAAQLF
ncbi:DUF554 domain-containing protein [Tessaracoccus sp. SD287]|uniref:DUF554 domain-containing protein n=1 Tax=Tessaracoccus sp. SD287 TaxID=2782008 RepID=UPI001A95F07A|nr:DUF554 domain-containing protein [Tessaracoccus sp. SD287]